MRTRRPRNAPAPLPAMPLRLPPPPRPPADNKLPASPPPLCFQRSASPSFPAPPGPPLKNPPASRTFPLFQCPLLSGPLPARTRPGIPCTAAGPHTSRPAPRPPARLRSGKRPCRLCLSKAPPPSARAACLPPSVPPGSARYACPYKSDPEPSPPRAPHQTPCGTARLSGWICPQAPIPRRTLR